MLLIYAFFVETDGRGSGRCGGPSQRARRIVCPDGIRAAGGTLIFAQKPESMQKSDIWEKMRLVFHSDFVKMKPTSSPHTDTLFLS